MANDLTGDFDVVAEFAVPAANRVIAAMHRAERFLHAMSVRVDDTHRRPDHRADFPTLVASIDSLGEPSVDHDRIPTRPALSGVGTAGPASSRFDSIVNPGLAVANLPELEISPLKGRAQIQLSPPTISVPDASGTNVTVKMEMRCRYFPDKDTPPLAEFIHGELQITAPVSRVASQDARVVEIDIKGVNVQTNFVSRWSSKPISAADMTAVNRLIKNSLRTSFLPSSNSLPSNIAHIQFKTLRGSQDALAVLLNMEGNAANPASHTNVFLAGGDDFAFAAGADFVRAQFQPTIDKISSMTIDPVSFTINGVVHTWHITYTFTLKSVALELRNGSILLTIKGHAHTGSWTPDFNFTVKQVITLKPVGSTAELELGDISVDTDSWVIDRFKSRFMNNMRRIRDRALSQSGAQNTVRKALNAEDKLGGLLASLLKPTPPKPGWAPPDYFLAYTSAEIRPSGIILHGSLAVKSWAAPHVEFERVPSTGSGSPLGASSLFDGPSYSALKSWIPGGTIERYEWSKPGQTQPFLIDQHKFIYTEMGPELVAESTSTSSTAPPATVAGEGSPVTVHFPGYVPLCVTITGTRLSASGAVVAQPVTAKICGINTFPVLGELQPTEAGVIPMVALTQPGPRGMVEVTGHTTVRSAPTGRGTPNLIVHFAAERSAPDLEVLTQALRESRRDDAATAILAVVNRDQLASTRYVSGIIYAEDSDRSWERAFGVSGAPRPVTLIAGPKRDVLWRHEGEVDSRTLAAALRKSLVATGPVRTSLVRARVRVGEPPPNFLFEHAPGADVTLRKLAGLPTTIVFWNRASTPSIEAVRELEQARATTVILAVNDGESSEAAKRAAGENKLTSTVVPDPDRQISRAYGVNVWPTIISLDANGLVSGIRFGRTAEDLSESASAQQSAE